MSERAVETLKQLCDTHLKDAYTLDVIDIEKSPEKAEKENIIVIPTLIRKTPKPQRTIIGNLRNPERILKGLEIK